MDNTPSPEHKDFDWKELEKDDSFELQMQEARAMAEQYKFAMPNPSGIDRNFQEDMINDMDMGE